MNARMNGSNWDDLDESTMRRIDMTGYRITEEADRYYVACIDAHGEAWTLTPDGVDTEDEAEALVDEAKEMAAQI